MKKFVIFGLLLSLFVLSPQISFGQARPRRAAQTPVPASAPASSAPSSTTTTRTTTTQTPAPDSSRTREVSEEVGEDEVVRVNTALVTIPVSIMDRDGRFIPNLRKEDFRIFEDGTEQEVAYFASVEQPFTVALVIDTSGSTRFKIEDIQNAALAFVDQLRPDDRVLVVSFDDRIRVLAEATSDRSALRSAIRSTRTGDGTKLYDAVDFVIKQKLNRIQGRKAIVLFTDGVDTTSKHASYRSTVDEAEELDALIYPLQYDTYNDQQMAGGGGGGGWPGPPSSRRRGSTIGDILVILGGGLPGGGRPGGGGGSGGAGTTREEYERGGQYLRELAEKSGGRHFQGADLRYIEESFTNIAEELRRQYSLGYYPSKQSASVERRQLKVRVKRPNLVVRARDNYIYKPNGATPATTTAQDDTTRQTNTPPELRKRPFAPDADRANQ